VILAAIDIGSNAARLLLQEVTINEKGQPIFTKINLIRIPLRLGFDVFTTGAISEERTKALVDTMRIYKLTMDIYKVEHYRACATSAMRDSTNGPELIEKIAKKTGIQIEIISGAEEAQIIYENHISSKLNKADDYLYVDVGGGSTELTLLKDQKIVYKNSFNIGTIRVLNEQVMDQQWIELKAAVKKCCKDMPRLKAIGTGGNINKIFSLSKTKDQKALTLHKLQDYLTELEPMTIEDRRQKYNLKLDRADVVVPALKIYTNIMEWANINEIYVPKIGVADGIIKLLYKKYLAQ